MVFDNVLKKLKNEPSYDDLTPTDEYLEIDADLMESEVGRKGTIKIAEINSFGDADVVQKHVRDGKIVFAKIKDLKEKDLTELKRAVERIKKTTRAVDGDIAGVDEDWLIITPHWAGVHRGPENPQEQPRA